MVLTVGAVDSKQVDAIVSEGVFALSARHWRLTSLSYLSTGIGCIIMHAVAIRSAFRLQCSRCHCHGISRSLGGRRDWHLMSG